MSETDLSSQHHRPFNPKWLIALPFLSLIFITRYEGIYIDESWHIDTAWTFVKTGRLAVSSWNGLFGLNIINFQPPLFNFLLGIWFKIVGLSFLKARLFMFFFSAPFLFFSYKIAKKLYDETIAIIATSVVFFWWFHAFRLVRYDLAAGVFCLAAYYCFLMAEDSRHRNGTVFLSGLLSALSPLSHLFGLIGAVCIGVLMLERYKLKIFLRKETALFAVGFLIPFLVYAATIFPVWDVVRDQYLGFHRDRVSFLSGQFYISNLKREYLRWFPPPFAFTTIFIIPSFLAFLITQSRRWKEHLPLLTFVICYTACLGLFIRNKTPLYLAPLLPFIAIGTALFWFEIYKKIGTLFIKRQIVAPSIWKSVLQISLILGVLVRPAYFLHIIFNRYGYDTLDFNQLAQKIKTFIPPSAAVLGQYAYYLPFEGQPFYSENLLSQLNLLYGTTFADGIRDNKIEYLIIDETLLYYQKNPDIEPFLDKYCTLVGSVKNKYYGIIPGFSSDPEGTIRIYKVNPNFYA